VHAYLLAHTLDERHWFDSCHNSSALPNRPPKG
jgi:hypothetical protein